MVRKSAIDWRIGWRVAQFRLSRKISQRQLAIAIGVTETTVQHYEHGRVEIPIRRLLQIARALGLPPGALMPPDDDIKKSPGVESRGQIEQRQKVENHALLIVPNGRRGQGDRTHG